MNAIASQRAHLRALEKLLARKRAVLKAQKSSIASHKHTHSSQDTASAQLLHKNPSPRASSFHAFTTEPLSPSNFCTSPHCRRGSCYQYFSASDGAHANIYARSAIRMRRTRKHNKRVMAFQEAQEYWETEFRNWYSKLSLEVRVDDEEEGR
jgi:hypothetical protein